MGKEQLVKETAEPRPPESTPPPAAKDMKPKAAELKEDMDKLIDEIDAVLERNAEQFVKDYVQRGGQ